MKRALLPLCLAVSCGAPAGGPPGGTGDGGTSTDGGIDVSRNGLVQFALSGQHRAWKAEPAVHASSGPHGKVRTFLNDVLNDSLKANNATHPNGSIAVKEIYDSAGTTVRGYAVDVKDPQTGEWVFFEGFAPGYDDYYFRGTSNLCGNCHAGGRDYVLVGPQ